MKIQYCCTKKILDVCHHNLIVEDEKMRIVDTLCQLKKEDLREAIEKGLVDFMPGWVLTCEGDFLNCEDI